jgi:hypothetical protein
MLTGLSKTGSCPIQTPFCTSAQMLQPTAQKGQTVFLRRISPSWKAVLASAFCTRRRSSAASPATPPAASPERSRNARRVRLALAAPAICASRRLSLPCPVAASSASDLQQDGVLASGAAAPITGGRGDRTSGRDRSCESPLACDRRRMHRRRFPDRRAVSRRQVRPGPERRRWPCLATVGAVGGRARTARRTLLLDAFPGLFRSLRSSPAPRRIKGRNDRQRFWFRTRLTQGFAARQAPGTGCLDRHVRSPTVCWAGQMGRRPCST